MVELIPGKLLPRLLLTWRGSHSWRAVWQRAEQVGWTMRRAQAAWSSECCHAKVRRMHSICTFSQLFMSFSCMYGVVWCESLCLVHTQSGIMRAWRIRRCQHEGCTNIPTFGDAARWSAVVCKMHRQESHVVVVGRRCEFVGCMVSASLGALHSILRTKYYPE